jgi:hypothetical protein
MSDEELAAIADDFERTEFTPDDIAAVKKTRRRSPRLGDTNAQVLTFRAPASYRDRIKARAKADSKSESQIIRDALDAYL